MVPNQTKHLWFVVAGLIIVGVFLIKFEETFRPRGPIWEEKDSERNRLDAEINSLHESIQAKDTTLSEMEAQHDELTKKAEQAETPEQEKQYLSEAVTVAQKMQRHLQEKKTQLIDQTTRQRALREQRSKIDQELNADLEKASGREAWKVALGTCCLLAAGVVAVITIVKTRRREPIENEES